MVLLGMNCQGADPFGSLAGDSEGDRLSRSHMDGSRWTGPQPSSQRPALALLWSQGDYQVWEFTLYPDGWSNRKSSKLFERTSFDKHLEPEDCSALTNLVRSLPLRSDVREHTYELIRVSWQDHAQWNSRTYSRTSPPEALVKMCKLIGAPLEFICKTLPESPAANVNEFPGPIRFASAACEPGLLLAGEGKVLLLDAYQNGAARYFPAPSLLTNHPWALAVTPDAKKMAVGTGKNLAVCEVESSKQVWQRAIPQHGGSVCIAMAPDASKLVFSSHGELLLCDLFSAAEPNRLVSSTEEIHDLAWSPDGRFMASASDQGLRLWDPSGKLLFAVTNSLMAMRLTFSPDSTRLAVVPTLCQEIKVYDLASRTLAFEIPCTTDKLVASAISPEQLAWSPDGSLLAVKGLLGPVLLCDVQKHAPSAVAPLRLASRLAFGRKGTSMISVGVDNPIHNWHLQGLGSSQ